MLVLSRKPGEKIVVGEGAGQVTVTIVKISGNQVRVGVEADPEIPIRRPESRGPRPSTEPLSSSQAHNNRRAS